MSITQSNIDILAGQCNLRQLKAFLAIFLKSGSEKCVSIELIGIYYYSAFDLWFKLD